MKFINNRQIKKVSHLDQVFHGEGYGKRKRCETMRPARPRARVSFPSALRGGVSGPLDAPRRTQPRALPRSIIGPNLLKYTSCLPSFGSATFLSTCRDTRGRPSSERRVAWLGMRTARDSLGSDRLVQGNIDPTVLLGSEAQIGDAVRDNIAEAGGRGRHILNVGHGLLQNTLESNVAAFVRAAAKAA